jgi:hypothetical protein
MLFLPSPPSPPSLPSTPALSALDPNPLRPLHPLRPLPQPHQVRTPPPPPLPRHAHAHALSLSLSPLASHRATSHWSGNATNTCDSSSLCRPTSTTTTTRRRRRQKKKKKKKKKKTSNGNKADDDYEQPQDNRMVRTRALPRGGRLSVPHMADAHSSLALSLSDSAARYRWYGTAARAPSHPRRTRSWSGRRESSTCLGPMHPFPYAPRPAPPRSNRSPAKC